MNAKPKVSNLQIFGIKVGFFSMNARETLMKAAVEATRSADAEQRTRVLSMDWRLQ